MNMQLDLYAMLFLLGGAQALFLAAALLAVKRGNRMANRILGIFLLALAIPLLMSVAHHTKAILNFPHLLRIETPLIFVYGPLFLLYVKALTAKDFALQKRHFFHFIPFLIYTAYLFPFYAQSQADKIKYWSTAHRHALPLSLHIETVLGICQVLIYLLVTVRLLAGHTRTIKESFSSIEKINLDWIRNLIIGFGALWAFGLIMYAFQAHGLIHFVALAGVSMIFYMGFKGLTQPEIFAVDEERQTVSKYARTALAPDKAEAYLEKLLNAMAAEKPFMEGDLSLQKLAKKLAIPSHHLSQVINEKLQQNFFEFVNRYRVEESKKQLADPSKKNLNIAEIGFQVGFNSPSTFNAAFKQHTQMTPSQFRKQCVNSVQ